MASPRMYTDTEVLLAMCAVEYMQRKRLCGHSFEEDLQHMRSALKLTYVDRAFQRAKEFVENHVRGNPVDDLSHGCYCAVYSRAMAHVKTDDECTSIREELKRLHPVVQGMIAAPAQGPQHERGKPAVTPCWCHTLDHECKCRNLDEFNKVINMVGDVVDGPVRIKVYHSTKTRPIKRKRIHPTNIPIPPWLTKNVALIEHSYQRSQLKVILESIKARDELNEAVAKRRKSVKKC